MSAPTLRYALAPSFLWTSAGAGADLAVTIGATPYTGTVATGSYRVLLGNGGAPGSTSEPLADFLQVVESALQSAIGGSGRTVSLALSPVTSLVTLAIDSGTFDVTPCNALTTLGFNSLMTGAGSYVADYPPRYFLTFIGKQGSGRQATTPGAWDVDESGRAYGVTSAVTTRREELEFTFLPTDTDTRTSLGVYQSAWEPPASDYGTLASISVNRPWTALDVLRAGAGSVWAFADGTFQSLAGSTASVQRYFLGTVSPQDLTQPRAPQQYGDWTAYRKLSLTFTVRSSTPTSTRS